MEKMERQLDYALTGYNIHDALELVERLVAERDGKTIDKEFVTPESLKIFSPDEYEQLQKEVDKNTAQQQRIKEYKTLRRVKIYDDDDEEEEEEENEKKEKENENEKKIEETKENQSGNEEENNDDGKLVPVKNDLDTIHKSLLFQISLYNEGIEEIDDPKNTWELTTEYENLSVYSKTIFTEKDKYYGMKLVGEFDCSVINVLACLIEYDLFPEWITYCEEVTPFEVTHYCKIARVLTGNYPWPISSIVYQREFLTSAIGVSRLSSSDRPSMMIIVYDPTSEEKERLGIPPPDPSVVRAREGTCVIEIIPLTKNTCKVNMVGFVDPVLITTIPNWLYKLAVKITGKLCFDIFKEACKMPKLNERIKQKNYEYAVTLKQLELLGMLPDEFAQK